jgi:hypothetical protein
MLKILDQDKRERNFHFEMQKHSMHLRADFARRQLAIYEIFKKTIELPGSIIELGVRNGANFFYFARLLEIFAAGQRYDGISCKHLYGFDTFGGFPSISSKDLSSASWHETREGGVNTDKEIFFHDYENFKKESEISNRLHIIEGDVTQTIEPFLQQNSGARFSLVYFDLDLYQPTKVCLEKLWDKIVPGGILVFDEYALVEFPGETLAVDEFFNNKNVDFVTIPWSWCPTTYVVKK